MKRPYDVIQAEIQKLQREAAVARNEERATAIKRIRAEMARFDISADELRGPMPSARGGARAKSTAAALVKSVAPAARGAVDESPAVRLLEEAGIDFRRKSAIKAPSSAKAARTASKKVATRNAATGGRSKAKGTVTG